MNTEQVNLLETCTPRQLINLIEIIVNVSQGINLTNAIKTIKGEPTKEGFLKEDLFYTGDCDAYNAFLNLKDLKDVHSAMYDRPYLTKGERFFFKPNRGWFSYAIDGHPVEEMDDEWAEEWLENIKEL